ncbi:hypothetical protein [Hathewaya massiliensis]|uniref:hypothetical protein n=1 Tax=Hathewaya massiliensis TaxID=1964382 RepID=UPI00115B003C|nr:hypothetical protein [Hathewaya massiliensis]
MPFRKVDPEEEIKKAIKNNPGLSKEFEKAEKEFEELKARKESTTEIRLYDHKTNRAFYRNLTINELTQIANILGVEWE